MASLIVLDVGHGNCAILSAGNAVAVVDAPIGSLLLDTLRDMKPTKVDAAFISHADKDHLAGVLALLTSNEVAVSNLYLNPDSARTSAIWRDLLAAVTVAQRNGTCVISTSLSSTTPGMVVIGDATVNVVAPSAALALRGVSGALDDGRVVSANSLSAVLRIETEGGQGVLLAGDMDEVGLDDALSHDADLAARVLVFPHHGGSPNGNAQAFTDRLIDAVKPASVVFSNGRNRYDLPQKEIVEAVVAKGCAVACTQMSQSCSSVELPDVHLESVRSHGKARGHTCAGSMSFDLEGGATRDALLGDGFAAFVEKTVPTPMCRVRSEPAP